MDDQSNSQSTASGLKRTLALSASALSDALGDWATGADPLNEQLATAVARAIEMGELAAGTRLPAERELARVLGLSRTTIVAAYDRLRESGLVRSRQGSGTRVAARRPGLTQAYPTPDPADPTRSGRSPAMTAHSIQPIGLLTPVIDDAVELTIGAMPAGAGVAAAIADALRDDVPGMLGRDGYDPFGLPALREEIAAHLRGRGVPTDPAQLLITSGAQQALYLIGSQLAGDGASVALENPTYIGAIDAFRATGNRLVPVPIDGDGARVEVIRLLAAGGPIRFAYIIPTFHNPTGAIMPEARRRDLVRLADEVGFQIVEDLTPDLTLGVNAPPPLAAFDPNGRVVTVGSLSKLAWGGLRIGYIRASRVDIDRLVAGKIVADHSTSLVTQAIATRVFRDIGSIARATRIAADQRRDLLTDTLGRRLPEWTWSNAQGGFSLWVRLPNADGTTFARLAAGHGVIVRPGPLASPDGGFRDHIRIAFGTAPDRLVEGVDRLASAWAAYAPTSRSIRSSIAVSV